MAFEELETLLQGGDDESFKVLESNKPQIAVVDDDPGVLAALAELLKTTYRVLLFEDAAEAVSAFTDDISAVILDVRMKGHDGFWACEAIRAKNPHVPVIFHSAYQDTKDPFEIINQYRPFGYIFKGSSVSVLIEAIERAVSYYGSIVEIKKLRSKLQQAPGSMA